MSEHTWHPTPGTASEEHGHDSAVYPTQSDKRSLEALQVMLNLIDGNMLVANKVRKQPSSSLLDLVRTGCVAGRSHTVINRDQSRNPLTMQTRFRVCGERTYEAQTEIDDGYHCLVVMPAPHSIGSDVSAD